MWETREAGEAWETVLAGDAGEACETQETPNAVSCGAKFPGLRSFKGSGEDDHGFNREIPAVASGGRVFCPVAWVDAAPQAD